MDNTYKGVTGEFIARKIEVKGNPEYVVEGYISTQDVDLFGDMVTDVCLEDMKKQLDSRVVKMDEEHETYHENNYDLIPRLKIVKSRIDKKGLWVRAYLNQDHPEFKSIWGSIKNGFLDAFSIQFVPVETEDIVIKGETIRKLDKVKLINVGITGTPVNPEAKLQNVLVKALNEMKGLSTTKPKEEKIKEEKLDDEAEVKSAINLLSKKGYKIIIPEDVQEFGKEKKALCVTEEGRKLPQNQTAHSSGEKEESIEPEDNKKMAEEIEQQETPIVEEVVEEAKPEAEEKSEEATEPAEPTAEPVETPETIDEPIEAEVKALRSEIAELKKSLAETKKKLSAPEFKAKVESAPQTKQNESTTPLELIG